MEKLAFVWRIVCMFITEVRVGDTFIMLSILINCSLRSVMELLLGQLPN